MLVSERKKSLMRLNGLLSSYDYLFMDGEDGTVSFAYCLVITLLWLCVLLVGRWLICIGSEVRGGKNHCY